MRGFVIVCLLFLSMIVEAQQNVQKKAFKKYEARIANSIQIPSIRGKEYTIRINSQVEFDDIAVKIRQAIQRRQKNILVIISPGLYYYGEQHLYLSGIHDPDLSIRVLGYGARLIAKGKTYTRANNKFSGTINYGHCFLSEKLNYLDFNGSYDQLQSMVEIVNEKKKLCRIKTSLPNQDASGASIQLNEWYMVKTYPITQIKNGYIYFTATDLEYISGHNCYNVNYDYGISKVMPRYLLKNLKSNSPFCIYKNRVVFPNGINAVHECTSSLFLVLNKCKINFFNIKGIEFIGNGNRDQLMHIREVKANSVLINNCTFRFLKNVVLRCAISDNVYFEDNVVEDCVGNNVWSDTNCKNTVIKNNIFRRSIHNIDRSSCVVCFSESFNISSNLFKDFGGIAIWVGLKHTQQKTTPISGIIENNEICYTTPFLSFMKQASLIDGGAIYLETYNDETIVRYNYIHGYGGIDSRRSIYCDDGCSNAKIYGNIIIQPDQSNAVFGWYSTTAAQKISNSNSGIDFMYNVIWGKYKMEERPKSDCVHGKNVMIYTGERPQNILKNFAAQEEDVYVHEPMLKNSLKELSPETMKAIRSLPTYEGMKKWFE